MCMGRFFSMTFCAEIGSANEWCSFLFSKQKGIQKIIDINTSPLLILSVGWLLPAPAPAPSARRGRIRGKREKLQTFE